MDVESGEKLMPQNFESIAVKRNIWKELALDIQLDVFQYLRAYDLYRNGRFATRQWYSIIEHHKGMLPKFCHRQDWRALNRLVGDNADEARMQRNEEVRRNVEYNERIRRKVERLRNKYLATYLVLSIISFITTLTAQFGDMSVERLIATSLLLAVTLRMGNTYEKFIKYRVSCSRHFYGDDRLNIFGVIFHYSLSQFIESQRSLFSDRLTIFGDRYYCYDKVMFIKYVWPAYLAGRFLIFGSIAILTYFITLPAMAYIFHIFLVLFHLPELAYTMNQSVSNCVNWCHRAELKRKIEMLRPQLKARLGHQFKNWYNEAPIHVNAIAWILGEGRPLRGRPEDSEPQKCSPNNQCFTPVQCNPSCSGQQLCNPMNGTCMTPPPGMHMGGQHQ
ncbi:hypothetical protein Ddc_16613 [Ditylenchus destructor]|nr:hypothetical protein Ddc_16613 [Ditylenchus destructor]